jgi:hypothetical protein
MTTIQDLIETLQELVATGTPEDAPVTVAFQPTYPLEADIANVTLVNGEVYIAATETTTYGPTAAWDDSLI